MCSIEIPTECESFDVVVVVLDPCDPPTSLSSITMADKNYVITDTAQSFSHPTIVADPSYCLVTYSYTIEALSNTLTPITVNS